MKMLQVILLVIVLMGIVVSVLSIHVLIIKDGKFLYTSIGANKYKKDRGVTSARTFDKIEQVKARKANRFNELILGK